MLNVPQRASHNRHDSHLIFEMLYWSNREVSTQGGDEGVIEGGLVHLCN